MSFACAKAIWLATVFVRTSDMLRARADWAALGGASNGGLLQHRAGKGFACGTTRLWMAAVFLKQRLPDSGLLKRCTHYRRSALKTYSPVTQQPVDGGMVTAALCAAAFQQSNAPADRAASLAQPVTGTVPAPVQRAQLVVLFTQPQPDAGPADDLVAAATRIALRPWAPPQRMP